MVKEDKQLTPMKHGFLGDKDKNWKDIRKQEEKNLILPIKENEKCTFCGCLRIDIEIQKTFHKNICYDCKFTHLKLITKTSAIKDFLLNDDELKNFKYLSKPNPRSGTWKDMQLYDIEQIRSKAIEKFGNLEEVEKEKIRRSTSLLDRKKKKVRNKIKDLRKKTLIDDRMKVTLHKHNFIETKTGTAQCECGLSIETENLLSEND